MDLQSHSTMICSVKRALLRWGGNSFHKIFSRSLQYKFFSFIDAPSNAESLNESPPVDIFGSIKTVWSAYKANELLAGTVFLILIPSLPQA